MTPGQDETLTDAAAAAAIHGDGWRLLLGGAYSSVAVDSLPAAVEAAAAAVRACGPHTEHLRLDLRAARVDLVLHTPGSDRLTRLDATLVARVTAAVGELGLTTTPDGAGRPVQALEIAVDALDISSVRPFWQAVFGYGVETRPIAEAQETVVVDPCRTGTHRLVPAARRPATAAQPRPLRPDRRRGRGRGAGRRGAGRGWASCQRRARAGVLGSRRP